MSAIHALSQLSYSPIGDVRKRPDKRTRPRDDISARTRSGSGELPVHDALDILLDDEHASAGLDLRHRALGLLGPSCEGQLRQADDEGRPLTGRRFCPDAPAMPRDDLARDVQTEPEACDPAIVVRSVEALEDPREPVARDTWSFVSDRGLELFAGARHTHGDGAS